MEALRDGDPIQIIFPARFLLEALQVMDTEGVVMDFTDPTKAVVVRPSVEETDGAEGEYLSVLMPLQTL